MVNIPELSEYFLYANDDFFVNELLSPKFFFDEDGRPICRYDNSKIKDDEKGVASFGQKGNIIEVKNVY